MKTGVAIDGLAQLQAGLRGTPRQINRATRNAVNRTLTMARKAFVDEFYSGTGATRRSFSSRKINRRLVIIRAKQGETEGRIEASDATLPLKAYNPKPVSVSHSGTRARLSVQDEYGQGRRVTRETWINPKAVKNRTLPGPMVTTGTGPRQASGPSMAVQLAHIAPVIEPDVGVFLVRDFSEQFDRQLKRGRR